MLITSDELVAIVRRLIGLPSIPGLAQGRADARHHCGLMTHFTLCLYLIYLSFGGIEIRRYQLRQSKSTVKE